MGVAPAGAGPKAAAPTLETPRLILRAHRLDDFGRLRDLYRTERSRFIGGPMGEQAVWQNFSGSVGQWPLLGIGCWAVELKAGGDYVGQVGVTWPIEYPEPELGWLLFDGYEKRGYGFEAAGRAKQFAIESAGLSSLVSYIDPGNAASIALAERLGGRQDRLAPTPNGDPCLVLRYV